MLSRLLQAACCLLIASTSYAQNHTCGSAIVNNIAVANDPQKAEIQRQLHEDAIAFTENYAHNRGGIKVIPVVVHVMHDGGDENISREQVLNAMEIINEDFRLLNTDNDQIIPPFAAIKADAQIEFRLARIDPDGNCTQGITWTQTELTFDAGENVKDLVNWNTSMYLNIWVVDQISIGAGGYSFNPGNAPSQSHEGIVVLNRQFGSIGQSNSSNFARRTLTHEIGHYLNLNHTWGSTNENAVEQNCFFGDGVNDTPNTIGSNQNCNLDQETCGSLDNVQNYMDYSTCGKMFTMGQAARMNSALNSDNQGSLGYYRKNLWQESNLIATGTNDGFDNVCEPIADFAADRHQICTTTDVQFTDLSYNADVDSTWTWEWMFEGGIPETSNEQNPIVNYPEAGVFAVSLEVSNSAGTNIVTRSSHISVSESQSNIAAPFSEGIENSEWPTNNSDPGLNWTIENETGTTWERNTNVAYTGNACASINLRLVDTDAINSIISPAFDISDTTMDYSINFRYAHSARNTEQSHERLRVYMSGNCGETWSLRFSRSGDLLQTTDDYHSNFTPELNEWDQIQTNVVGFDGSSNLLVKFETLSDRESKLYLDDINLTAVPTGISEGNIAPMVNIFPNPSAGTVNLSTRLPATQVEVFDLSGKQVYYAIINPTNNKLVDLSDQAEGVYTVRFQHETGISVKKLVLTK